MIVFASTALALLLFRLLARWVMEWVPALRRHSRATFGVFALLGLSPVLARALANLHAPFGPVLYGGAMLGLMVLVLGMPILAAWRALLARLMKTPLSEAGRPSALPLARLVVPPDVTDPAPPPPSLHRRHLFEGAGGVMVLGGLGLVFTRGYLRTRFDLEIREYVVRIAGLPRALDGYVITQVSDLHVGTFMKGEELKRGLARVRETKADLLVVTGDLVDFEASYAPMAAAAIADVAPRDGVVAILGNHDVYAGSEEVLRAYAAAGVRSLVNDGYVHRPHDAGGFALLGVDDYASNGPRGKAPDLRRALAAVPEDRPRILLAHQPRFIEHSQGEVLLQLSGHTHGGQVELAGFPARAFMAYVEGGYSVGATKLWVNRGFGTSGPPTRVGARPEITKIVLVSA